MLLPFYLYQIGLFLSFFLSCQNMCWKWPSTPTSLALGELTIKYWLKFRSRNCWYCAATVTAVAWLAHCQSNWSVVYMAYCVLLLTVHFNLLSETQCNIHFFCLWVCSVVFYRGFSYEIYKMKWFEKCHRKCWICVPGVLVPSKYSTS